MELDGGHRPAVGIVEGARYQVATGERQEADEHEERDSTSPHSPSIPRRNETAMRTVLESSHPRPAPYLMSLMMLNIGMYREITMPPTAPPSTTIRAGSSRDVKASTVASISRS